MLAPEQLQENKQNNNPENLMIFKNQSEHAKYHAQEVMPNANHER